MSTTRYASVLGLGFGDCGKGHFIDALTSRASKRVGDAFLQAKQATASNSDNPDWQAFIMLGDPAIELVRKD